MVDRTNLGTEIQRIFNRMAQRSQSDDSLEDGVAIDVLVGVQAEMEGLIVKMESIRGYIGDSYYP